MKRRAIASLLAVGALVVGGIAAGCGGRRRQRVRHQRRRGRRRQRGEARRPGAADRRAGRLRRPGREGGRPRGGADQHRRRGDSGFKVTLVTEDTKTDPQAAQEAATKVIESDGVGAIAGPWGTPELIPTVENVTVDAGHPDRDPVGDRPGHHDARGRRPGVPHAAVRRDPGQGAGAGRRGRPRPGQDGQHGQPQRRLRRRAGQRVHRRPTRPLGGTVGKNVSYNPEATSLNSEAQQIARGQPRRLGDHRLHRHVAEARPRARADRQVGPGEDVHRRRPALDGAAGRRGQGDDRGHPRHRPDVARRSGRRGVRRPLEGGDRRARGRPTTPRTSTR